MPLRMFSKGQSELSCCWLWSSEAGAQSHIVYFILLLLHLGLTAIGLLISLYISCCILKMQTFFSGISPACGISFLSKVF